MSVLTPKPTSVSIYTIGYATKPMQQFIAHLQQHRIDVVADIRSVPYSKVFHDYHKESIQQHLRQHKIRYVYLGDELGPRSKDPSHYDDSGQVQFDRLMQSALFEQGIKRLIKGLEKGFRIALMCAEKDPATCHRSLLVGYFLSHHLCETLPEYSNRHHYDIFHINHEGHTEKQEDLEQRLCVLHDLGSDFFSSPKEQAYQAYQKQLTATSYRKP